MCNVPMFNLLPSWSSPLRRSVLTSPISLHGTIVPDCCRWSIPLEVIQLVSVKKHCYVVNYYSVIIISALILPRGLFSFSTYSEREPLRICGAGFLWVGSPKPEPGVTISTHATYVYNNFFPDLVSMSLRLLFYTGKCPLLPL